MKQIGETKPESGFFRNATALCGGIAATIGVLGLLGWISGLRVLASIDPNYIPMAPDTAVVFVVLGLILLVNAHSLLPSRERALVAIVVALASVYGLLKFVEYFAKLDLTFENILFPITEKLGSFPVGRMSPISGALFFLSGAALLLTLGNKASELTRNLVGGLGILVLIAGFVATTGYLFGTPLLYGSDIIPLAATTAIAFMLLGIGLVAAAGPANVFVRPLVGSSVRARMLRAFLPLTATVVLVQGLFYEIITERLSVNHALLSAAFTLIFVAAMVVAVTQVARIISHTIDSAEAERKRAEERVIYQAHLLEYVHDAIVASDAEYRLTAWNAAAERIYGWKAEEVLGRNGLEIVQTQFPEAERAEILRAIGETGYYRGEATQARKDGSRFPVDVSSIVLREAGRITGYVSVNRDITERKRAEHSLGSLAAIVESSDDAIYGKTLDGIVTTWNGAAEKIYGYSKGEIIGRPIAILVPPDRAEELEQIMEKIRHRERVQHFETVRVRKDGTPIDVAVTISPIEDANGKIIGASAIARDITERKQAEEALRRAEEKYHAIVDYAVEGIFQSTPEGRFITANPAQAHMLGYASPQELISSVTDIAQQVYVDSSHRAEFRRLLEEQDAVQGFEFQARRKDGSVIWISQNARAVRDTNGALLYYEGITEDITERKRADEELRNLARFPDENPNPILRVSRDGVILYANRSSHGWLEILNTHIGNRVPSAWHEIILRVLETGKLEEIERGIGPQIFAVIFTPFRDSDYVNIYGHDITKRKQAEARLQYVSMHDGLTGLYNRTFFEEEVARLERSRQFPVSVVMADLNGLKQINDSEGHAAGDELLRRAARVFKTAFRAEDVVARIGGDEFAVLLPNADAPTAGEALARVRKCLTDENAQHRELPLSFALGVATANGHGSLAAAMKEADQRMYEDKFAQAKSKNGVDL